MDKDQIALLEKKLDAACRQFVARGGTLIRGRYTTGEYLQCCPIRAAILLHDVPKLKWSDRILNSIGRWFGRTPLPLLVPEPLVYAYHEGLSKIAGFSVSHKELMSISHGVDSHIHYNPSADPIQQELFLVGRRLSEKYRTVMIP
jgi:hypothetical protein